MISPRWDGSRWIIQPMRDGKRYTFTSSTPGSAGKREVRQRYEAWLFNEGGGGQKTVERVAKEYLDDLAARRGSSSESYIQNERYIRLYIAPVCGQKKICKMTLRDWQNVINSASGQNGKVLSHKTLENLRGIIMGIIRFGYSDYQNDLPRGELYIPQGHPKKEKEFLDASDLAKLFQPSELWYHPLFVFLSITGMRPGEALGLKISDVMEDRVRIRRSVNAHGVITEGKNENAKRIVPIGSLAKSIIQKTIERNRKYNLRTDWIFCDIGGGPGNQSTMRNQWLALKKERGIPGTVYSLRHTFITMVKNVMPEQTIKDIVGHSTSMPTFSVYGHIPENEGRSAAKIIDLTFGQFSDITDAK